MSESDTNDTFKDTAMGIYDTKSENVLLGGGILSRSGSVVVATVTKDDEIASFPVKHFLKTIVVTTDPNVSVVFEAGPVEGEGYVGIRFIGDFAGRAYVLARNDEEINTTFLTGSIGHTII